MPIIRTLSGRLLLASALILPVFLGLTGYLLNQAFHRTLITAEQAQLRSHLYLLLSEAEWMNEELWLPDTLIEPGFSQPKAGLYGIVTSGEGLKWRSASTRLTPTDSLALPDTPIQPGQQDFLMLNWEDTPLYAGYQDVIWETEQADQPLRFIVLRSRAAMLAQLKTYQHQLWLWLGSTALLLMTAQWLILYWGLRPLGRLGNALRHLEDGDSPRLAGSYPLEIQGLADSLNQVLQSQQAQQARYRNGLADLAHSLKTPLAVLRGCLESTSDWHSQRVQIAEQAQRMEQIVTYQLKRASHQDAKDIRDTVPLAPAVNRITRVLSRVYQEKSVEIHQQIPDSIGFSGHASDLLELLGNLLDNACKHCHHRVSVSAELKANRITLSIEDDGTGVPAEQQAKILQRGERGDTVTPGQGIGLAIVTDILSSYQGSLQVDQSRLGGAAFIMTLPGRHLPSRRPRGDEGRPPPGQDPD